MTRLLDRSQSELNQPFHHLSTMTDSMQMILWQKLKIVHQHNAVQLVILIILRLIVLIGTFTMETTVLEH